MQDIYNHIIEIIKPQFEADRAGHGMDHLLRVHGLALQINNSEREAGRKHGDEVIIGVAALVHDIHRLMQVETGEFVPPKDSLDRVSAVLNKVEGISDIQKEKILHSVEHHELYNFGVAGEQVSDIETLILQDADNLDAVGAVGLVRAISYAISEEQPIWDGLDDFEVPEGYVEDGTDKTLVHHIKWKLVQIVDNMNTETGKEIGKSRKKLLSDFAEQYMSETKELYD